MWTFQFGLNEVIPKKAGKLVRAFLTLELNEGEQQRGFFRNVLFIQSLPSLSTFWRNVTNDKRFTARP